MTNLLVICTGNAARSVMVGAILNDRRPDLSVVTAGTLTVDGQPVSWRTREALRRIGLEPSGHRSKQIEAHHVEAADLVIALAPEHIEWMRRNFAEHSHRVGSLKRLHRDLAHEGPLQQRIADLRLHELAVEPWEEVVDPGGGEVEAFIECAYEVVTLTDELVSQIGRAHV